MPRLGAVASLLPGLYGLRSATVGSDVVAGFTVWAVLVPESLAYSTIAGVPPVVGLYAAPAALVLYALLGSSRHLIVGPMAAAAALSAAAVAARTTDPETAVRLTVVLALVVGVLGVIAAGARLGFLASFLSEPVLKGFIIGLALTIISGQAPKLLGLESSHGDFVERVRDLLSSLGDTHAATVIVGVASLAVIFGVRRFAPRAPAPLVAVAGATVSSTLFDLGDRGIAVVGSIEAGLPSVGLPDVGWSEYVAIAGSAAGILLVGFAEGLAAAKTYAARAGYRVAPNRELLGLGAANIGAGLSSGMVVAGSLSKTAVNGAAGARSQLSGLTAAALTIVTLLVLTPVFEQLPEPTLGAVVIAAVIELVDFAALRRLYGLHSRELARIYGSAARADLIAASAALVGVLIFDTLPGLFIGIGASAALLAYRSSRPHVAVLARTPGDDGAWLDATRHPEAVPCPDVLVVRPEGGLFYGNADNVEESILTVVRTASEPVRGVVLDAQSIPSIDATATAMLVRLAQDLQRTGARMMIARDVGQVRDVLRASDGASLSLEIHTSVDDAIEALGPASGHAEVGCTSAVAEGER